MDDFYKDAGLITQASDTQPNQSPHPNQGSGSAPPTKLGRSPEGEMNLPPTYGFSPRMAKSAFAHTPGADYGPRSQGSGWDFRAISPITQPQDSGTRLQAHSRACGGPHAASWRLQLLTPGPGLGRRPTPAERARHPSSDRPALHAPRL